MENVVLTSKRLHFKLVVESDLANIHALHSIPEVDEFNTLGIPENLAQTKEVVDNWVEMNNTKIIQNYAFKILDESDTFIGLFGLKLSLNKYQRGEVWYKFHPMHWGKGYATEALKRVLEFGFEELNLHRIEAGCAVGNIGSIKVLEKVGMTKEGRFRQLLPLKSGWSDNFEYAILSTDPRI